MGIFSGMGLNGCNSSCDVLEIVVIGAIISKLLKKSKHCEGGGFDGCFGIKIDLCTIAILFIVFGGLDKFFKHC